METTDLHPSQLAQFERAAHRRKGELLVQPGSPEEEDALDAIDYARDAELRDLSDTPADRARRHWHATRHALSHDPVTRR